MWDMSESLAVNLLTVHELGELPPYVCISALHDIVGKMRNCGIRNAEGEIRNGPEWNVRNVTEKRKVICGMRKVVSAQRAERFEPNTVLWAFHTIQQSSVNLYSAASSI